MARLVQVDQLQPTNADLMSVIIGGRNEVKQLQKKVEDLAKIVKSLQDGSSASTSLSADDDRRRHLSNRISMQESTKLFMLRNVDFDEIERSCNGWSDPLGAGGFGEVFKGVWNGQNIAVKRLRNDKRPGDIKG